MKTRILICTILLAFLCTVPAIVAGLSPPGGDQGYFSINSIPSGGDVFLDNVFAGESPITLAVSTTGSPQHVIAIRQPGYEAYTVYPQSPAPGETVQILATLTPSSGDGTIKVVSTPTGAFATLDRSLSQATPCTFPNVPQGSHAIDVYLAGYQTYSTVANVQGGQTVYISATLTAAVSQGSLSVGSSPTAAAVYLDGAFRGSTPTTIGNLVPGQHSVRLSKSGFKDWENFVTIQSGQTASINPFLNPDINPSFGSATIITMPPGASVFANGAYIGRTGVNAPLVFTEVPPGYYSILISRAGYEDYTQSGMVKAGENYNIVVTLVQSPQAANGSISVTSDPTGADVFLNSQFSGVSPVTFESLAPGTYSLLLKMGDHQDWQTNVQVTAGQATEISANLTASPPPAATPLVPAVAVLGLAAAALVIGKRT
jgi:hypothetical protein